MTTTTAYPAKRAVFDQLREWCAAGHLGNDLEVHYAWPGDVGMRLIYGGGWRFQQQDAVAERGVLMQEIVAVSLYIRVVARPAVPVEETDEAAHLIGNQVGRLFVTYPQLAGDLTWLGIASGEGDYARTDNETISIHAYQVQVGSHLTWGGVDG